MRVEVRKWGNSLALRIPKPVAEDVGVEEGSVVDMTVSKGRLLATPARPRRRRLSDLLGKVTRKNRHGEVKSGRPVGREIW